MLKNLFALLIFLFLASCTIQKRVYQKGWDIQMHKALKSKQTRNEVEKEISQAEVQVTSQVEGISNTLIFEDDQIIEKEIIGEDELLDVEREFYSEKIKESSNRVDIPNLVTKSLTEEKVDDETLKNNDGPIIGIVLIFVSVLAAALAILILSAELTMFTIIGGSLMGLAGLVFLTLGIFYIIRQSKEKRFPEKKEERLKTIREEKAAEDYNPDRFNIILGVIVVSIVAALFIFLKDFN